MKFSVRFTLFLLSFIYGALGMAQYEQHLFIAANDTLPYRLLKPEVNLEGPFPLVLFLHGAGERGRDNVKHTQYIDKLFLDSAHRQKFPCYLVAPQCPPEVKWTDMKWKETEHRQSAEPTWPIKRTKHLVDSLIRVLNVDTSRIYVTGLSMGGYGTFDFCARYGKVVAAAAPVCGGYDVNAIYAMEHISFRMYHGAQDMVVPVANSQKMAEAMRKKKIDVQYIELPEVKHDAWLNAYKSSELLEWLFSKRQ
jgi:predicted peptidase